MFRKVGFDNYYRQYSKIMVKMFVCSSSEAILVPWVVMFEAH
jgi:hypothetical protein